MERSSVLLVFLYFLGKCISSNTTNINSFLKERKLSMCTILTCGDSFDKTKILKKAMMSGSLVAVLNTLDQNEDQFNQSLSMDYGAMGVVLHLHCGQADKILYWASKYNKYMPNYHWLLIDNLGRGVRRMIDEWKVEFNLESEVIWVLESANPRVFEVYQTGCRPFGQLVISELAQGSWTARHWRLDKRLDLQGLILNVSLVVKPNSVGGLGSTQTSDATDLQDPEEIVKYLTDDEFPHLDSLMKFSWGIFKLQKDLFNFSIRMLPTSSWGYIFNGKNFDGMVGMLSNKSADVGGTVLAIRLPRLSVVDYTSQMWPYQSRFILRHPRQSAKSDAFTRPLSEEVWLSVGLVVLFVFILLWSSNWLLKHQMIMDGHSWAASIIIIQSALAQQGSVLVPKQLSGRLVFLCLFLWASLIYQFYTSSLVSSLLSPPRRYINTISDLVHSPFTIGFEKIITSKDILTRFSSIMPEVKEMYVQKVAPRGDAAYYTPSEGISRVKKGHFAFYVDPASAYKLLEDTLTQPEICDLVEVILNPKEVLAFPVQKGSPFKKLFIYGQRKCHEAGIVKRELIKWQSRKPVCVKSEQGGNSQASATEPVGISQSAPAFIMLAAGLLTSLIILLCEKIYYRYTHMRNKLEFLNHYNFNHK